MSKKFFLADTFQNSLSRLNVLEQKIAKTAAFDLQMNSSSPALNCHRISKIKDKNFWSARVNRDIRIIFHKTGESTLLCFVAHHDDAYKWAEKRKIEIHPVTGAAQMVEIREKIKEIEINSYKRLDKPEISPTNRPLSTFTDNELLKFGVPSEWIQDLTNASENQLLEIASHLPGEAGEAIINLAIGKIPEQSTCISPENINPLEHPDAKRRFALLSNNQQLQTALKYPWEKWITFLHPAQKNLVEKKFNGHTKVLGSAGTGKTVIAIHRAVHIVRENENIRVLITTFSKPLVNLIVDKLKCMLAGEPELFERIDVLTINELGKKLFLSCEGFLPNLISNEDIESLIISHAPKDLREIYGSRFVIKEFINVVDQHNINDWDTYKKDPRLGMNSRLNESKRQKFWPGFEKVKESLKLKKVVTYNQLFFKLSEVLKKNSINPYQHVIVDECQDISPSQLNFLSNLVITSKNPILFVGDLGQRIFQSPFSWSHYGFDVRGRSYTLNVNYRTTEEIRNKLDKLLDSKSEDVDGIIQQRRNTISLLNGKEPEIINFDNNELEQEAISKWIIAHQKKGIKPNEFGIFVRSENEICRAINALNKAKLPFSKLEKKDLKLPKKAILSTMHLSKGLEFKAVIVMACDENVIPNHLRIKDAENENELKEIYSRERYLLYVACTRARDFLLISSSRTSSEFIEDLK